MAFPSLILYSCSPVAGYVFSSHLSYFVWGPLSLGLSIGRLLASPVPILILSRTARVSAYPIDDLNHKSHVSLPPWAVWINAPPLPHHPPFSAICVCFHTLIFFFFFLLVFIFLPFFLFNFFVSFLFFFLNNQDFLNANSQFDVGVAGSKVLQNCLAYKLCYHRFGELRVRTKKWKLGRYVCSY